MPSVRYLSRHIPFPTTCSDLTRTTAQTPQHTSLFHDLATYTLHLRHPSTLPITNGSAPSKKRKLDDPNTTHNTDTSARSLSSDWKPGYHTIPETSFLIPQRKKLGLEISTLPDEGLRARNPSTGVVEFGVCWKDVRHILCVPVPEKAQRQYTFCVFPTGAEGLSAPEKGNVVVEPVVWMVVDGAPKGVGVLGIDGEVEEEGVTLKVLITRALNKGLGAAGRGVKVVEPEEREFASAIGQAHRKGERAFHVGAFRGSKDGSYTIPFTHSVSQSGGHQIHLSGERLTDGWNGL